MGTISRGFKNAFRNGVRSISVVLILSIAIGMTLIMFMSLKTVQAKIDTVKSNIGNAITVSPAGIRGFEGGGDLLTSADVDAISKVPHVSKVVKTVSDRLTNGTDTNLLSAIDAGAFGNRTRQRQNQSSNQASSNRPQGAFTMPVMVTGTSDLSVTSSLNVSKFDITSGVKFNEATSDNVAIVGTDLAKKNNLSVGSVFQAYGKDVKVSGIFDGGNTFANATLIMPLSTLQNLSGQAGQTSQVMAQVDSIDNVFSVESALKSQLGSKADVVSQQDSSAQALAPLQNIKTISLYSLIGSMIAGAVILFLTMIMIVRERRREIGVLKAIGSSNLLVTAQFAVEALVLTVSSSIVGIILGTFLSNPILKVLVSSNTAQQAASGTGGRALMRLGSEIANGAQGAIRDLSATVSLSIILYGLLVAVVIAILGSVIPSFIIAKISPAEVMRAE